MSLMSNLGTAIGNIFSSHKTRMDGIDDTLALKADSATTLDGYGITNAYTKTETDASLGLKADVSNVYTKAESDATKVEVLGTVSEAIANLVSAQGQIRSSTGDVFASIPTTATVMPFEVATAPSDTSVFDFDDANNTITFKHVGKYNFTSNVSIKSNVSAARTLTFTLVNTADDSVVSTETGTFNMASGTSQIVPMSTLLDVTTAPLTIQIKAQASDTGYVLHGFSSTLVSSVQVTLNVNTVEGLPEVLLGKLDVNAKAADSGKLDGLDSTAFTRSGSTITLTGDVTGSATVSSTGAISVATTIAANSVALGTDTTGNYVAGATAGTGIAITGTAGEGWSPTITNSAPNVTTDISITHNATTVVVNSSDGTDGIINAATQSLAGALSATDKVKLDGIAAGANAYIHPTGDGNLHVPATGTTNNGKVLKAGATAGSASWGTLTAVDVGAAPLTGTGTSGTWGISITGNSATTTKLATAKTINDVSFDGSANINIEDRLGTTIASAATTTIGTLGGGETRHISGTTTITSFGVSATGTRRIVIFDGVLTVTHNATSLIMPAGANIITSAGDSMELVCENGASGYWRCVNYHDNTLSNLEYSYLNGVTSAIQTQLNAKAPLASPALTGTPTAPTATAGTNTTQLATTAFVLNQANDTATNIKMNGVQAAGVSESYARADHVHPTDTTRQATLVSGTNIKTVGGVSILGSGDISLTAGGVGVGQTFQYVARTSNVTYTNSTGKPIQLLMAGADTGFTLTLNGSITLSYYFPGNPLTTSLVIPIGGTYLISGNITGISFWELR